jgi:HSP20 family protein
MALPIRRGSDKTRDNDRDRGTLTRFDPFAELERLNRQLTSYLDSWDRLPGLLGDAFTPVADVEETDDAYVVEIELAGVKRDDVDIEVAGRRVTVRGERKERERVGILRRRERTVGRFHYEVVLPGDVDDEGVEAHLDEGVLTVRLPKPAHDRPRRIEIH